MTVNLSQLSELMFPVSRHKELLFNKCHLIVRGNKVKFFVWNMVNERIVIALVVSDSFLEAYLHLLGINP